MSASSSLGISVPSKKYEVILPKAFQWDIGKLYFSSRVAPAPSSTLSFQAKPSSRLTSSVCAKLYKAPNPTVVRTKVSLVDRGDLFILPNFAARDTPVPSAISATVLLKNLPKGTSKPMPGIFLASSMTSATALVSL